MFHSKMCAEGYTYIESFQRQKVQPVEFVRFNRLPTREGNGFLVAQRDSAVLLTSLETKQHLGSLAWNVPVVQLCKKPNEHREINGSCPV